mmetsp:Transcript_31383/g.50721  ORF Transcript_31383/g.50721 Transcript_31383/m.50721 type:complete len:261 (-) Transcript_31383:233-1015(-)
MKEIAGPKTLTHGSTKRSREMMMMSFECPIPIPCRVCSAAPGPGVANACTAIADFQSFRTHIKRYTPSPPKQSGKNMPGHICAVARHAEAVRARETHAFPLQERPTPSAYVHCTTSTIAPHMYATTTALTEFISTRIPYEGVMRLVWSEYTRKMERSPQLKETRTSSNLTNRCVLIPEGMALFAAYTNRSSELRKRKCISAMTKQRIEKVQMHALPAEDASSLSITATSSPLSKRRRNFRNARTEPSKNIHFWLRLVHHL